MRKLWLGATVLLLSTVVAFSPAPAGAAGPPADAGQAIPGQFIITLRDGADARSVAAEYRRDGADIDFVYTAALNGFAGRMSDASVTKARSDGRVVRVERDQVVTASATTQENATWGLDRIDQRELPVSGTYTYHPTGLGVTAYVIDTGIRATHVDFGGRVSGGYTAISDGNGTNDCNGHGTHVAGTIGGTTWGVAKGVNLVPVRVLDCTGSGTWSGVIGGVDWVTANAVKPAVANMSLGGGASTAVDNAVKSSIASGVTYAVAAGNSNQNACNYSPARASTALTVGATTSSDARASYSNFGSCLDLFAPGSSITSAWHTSTTDTNMISGTSMASPHVAGVAALYLETSPGASPASVEAAVEGAATIGKVTSAGRGSPNLLLYSLLGSTDTPPSAAPVTSVTTSSTSDGSSWRAQVTVSGAAEGTVTKLEGGWSGTTGPTSCTATGTGSCTLTSSLIRKNVSSVTFDMTSPEQKMLTISKP